MVTNGISILVPLAEMRDKEGNAGHPESLFLDTPLQKAQVKSEEEAFLSRREHLQNPKLGGYHTGKSPRYVELQNNNCGGGAQPVDCALLEALHQAKYSSGPMEIRYTSISVSSPCAQLSQACGYKSVIAALGRLRQKGHRFNIREITRLSHKSRDLQVSNDLTENHCGDLEETELQSNPSCCLFVFNKFTWGHILVGTEIFGPNASTDLVSLLFI